MTIGRFYRRKTIAEAREFETFAAMEDDFHHFAVRLRHDRKHVTELTGKAVRFPWSTCPGAVAKLDELIGAPLFPTAADPAPKLRIAEHCTHLFDIAKFAIAQTVRAQSAQGNRRQYDILIPDPVDGRTEGDLSRDGIHLFHWKAENRIVVWPPAFAGHQFDGRAVWPPGSIEDADALEAALMLRRALVIFRGRMEDYPEVTSADQVPGGFGTCFTYQPENSAGSRWVMDEKNYSASPDLLLAGFDAA
ncbi:MAG: hypothetical protein JWM91_1259 [Rhodospirillales bacterium]|nr:hypothetical protein [Rhodospirillales bacterium]